MESNRRWFQLSLRTLLEIVAVVAVLLAFAFQYYGMTGRYKMMTSPRIGGGSEVYFYDSATGRIWQQNENGTWSEGTLPGLK